MSNNSEHVGKQNIIIRALTWMNINSCIYLFISQYKVYKKNKKFRGLPVAFLRILNSPLPWTIC